MKLRLRNKPLMRGFTIAELVIIATIVLIAGGITVPYLLQIWSNMKLLAATADVSDLMQKARILAAKNNAVYQVRFQTNKGTQQVYIDLNNDATLDTNTAGGKSVDPYIDLPSGITAAAGAPNGTGGQPTAYTLVGDTSSGTPFDNTHVLGFSQRGLPCNYVSSTSTCSTPAASYFVYYFQDGRPNGWSGVLATKSGRTKAIIWNGSTWH
jgi:Tfp pilus assembly major pilin PilA